MFRFASPYFFLILLVIPLAVYVRGRRQNYPSLGVSSLYDVWGIKASVFLRMAELLPVLKYTALCFMVFALARPQWETKYMNTMTEGVNIVLAVDLSESMAALDFNRKGKIINRLEAVKGVINDFIAKRSGDRIGMVVFGSQAYTQLPLTRDYNAVVSILERLKIGAAGKKTAIGDAIGISLRRLKDIKSQSNIIILLTDGHSNAGQITPLTAAELASDRNVKIYCVGVGTKGRAPFLVNHPVYGERYIYQQVNIDEKTLKTVAEKTGGLYFRAESMEGLERIYGTIDRMEKTEVNMKIYRQYDEYYLYFLIPAMLLLTVWILLSNTRLMRVP